MKRIISTTCSKATEYSVCEINSESKREDRTYRISADDDESFGVSISCPDGEMWIPTRDMPLFIKMLQDFIK